MEVAAALTSFGYEMTLQERLPQSAAQGEADPLAMDAETTQCVGALPARDPQGQEGHWILVKGVKMCDTFTEGQWTFVVDGPHRGCRIMEIFEIKKQIAFQPSRHQRTQSLARST